MCKPGHTSRLSVQSELLCSTSEMLFAPDECLKHSWGFFLSPLLWSFLLKVGLGSQCSYLNSSLSWHSSLISAFPAVKWEQWLFSCRQNAMMDCRLPVTVCSICSKDLCPSASTESPKAIACRSLCLALQSRSMKCLAEALQANPHPRARQDFTKGEAACSVNLG